MPEYDGIQNLTGLNLTKEASSSKKDSNYDDLFRTKSAAPNDEDEDLQALYANMAAANEKKMTKIENR